MSKDNNYFDYLTTRSIKSKIYRNYFLYPKLNKYMNGDCIDVGCGIGDFLRFRPHTVGIDINPSMVEYCNSHGLDCEEFDGANIPFQDNRFDCAIIDNVLEHISDPRYLLFEIKRVIKKNGILVVGVPGIKGFKSDDDHKIFYSRKNLSDLFEEYGFIENKFIEMPFPGMSKYLRQYCIYSVFVLKEH